MRTPTGERIESEQHNTCPVHAAMFAEFSSRAVVHYLCTMPTQCAHADHEQASAARTPTATELAAKTAARRLVIQGNKDWRAAEANRREWLRTLLRRSNTTREHAETLARWTATAYLTAPEPVASGLGNATTRSIQAELLGVKEALPAWEDHLAAKPARSLPLATFAPLAACYERVMTDKTWRNDLDSWMTAHRRHARSWLSLCQSLGHVLSPIEHALLADKPYAPADATPSLPVEDAPDPTVATGEPDENDSEA